MLKVRMAGSVGKKASALVASDPDNKRLAEKSFTSYVRAVQLMPDKQVCNLRAVLIVRQEDGRSAAGGRQE